MDGSEADAYLRAYAGGSPNAVPDDSPSLPSPAPEESHEEMPETVPDAPKKEGFFRSLFSKGSGIASAGGLGAALLVLIILYLAIVPANGSGDTRLELIWATLRGKTQLNPSAPTPVQKVSAAVSSAVQTVTQDSVGFDAGLLSTAETGIIDFERWIGGRV